MACPPNQTLFILDSAAMRETAKTIVDAPNILLSAIHNFGVRCAACDAEIEDAALGRVLAIILDDIHYIVACCTKCANSKQLGSTVRSSVEDNLYRTPERYILAPDPRDGDLKKSTIVKSDMPQEIDDQRWFSKNQARTCRIRRPFRTEVIWVGLRFMLVSKTKVKLFIAPRDIDEDEAIAKQHDNFSLLELCSDQKWISVLQDTKRLPPKVK
ncbi:hypothetical protein ACFL17_06555 [Pseudomonadota bacterium]